MKYKARENWPISDEQAQLIGSFIEEEFGGAVTPVEFVQAAKNPESPVHSLFDWDVQRAAEKHWLSQAATYIKAVVVVIEGVETPAFHRVFIKARDSFQYVDVDTATHDEELWRQVIQAALKEAKAWALRYRQYKQLSAIVVAIEETEKAVQNEKTVKQSNRARVPNPADRQKDRDHHAKRHHAANGPKVRRQGQAEHR